MIQDKVALILINWNSYDYTDQCICSIKGISYPYYDIIVVDNDSMDDSGKRLKVTHPEIILIEAGSNLGFAGGNNLGMRYATDNGYPFIALLNNDTLVTEDFLTSLVRYLREHPETGAVQPRIFFEHDRSLLWNGGSYYHRWVGFTYSARFNKTSNSTTEKTRVADWLTGCCIVTRAEVIKKAGLLDERFFMYYEDVDYSFRIRKAGYNLVYVPESVIFHVAGGSGRLKKKSREGNVHPAIYYYSLRNKIWFLKRYTRFYEWPGVFVANALFYSLTLFYFLFRWRMVKLKAAIKAIFAGINGKAELYSN